MDKLPELCEQGRAVDRVKVMSGLLMQSIGVVPRNHPSLICVGGGFFIFRLITEYGLSAIILQIKGG